MKHKQIIIVTVALAMTVLFVAPMPAFARVGSASLLELRHLLRSRSRFREKVTEVCPLGSCPAKTFAVRIGFSPFLLLSFN
jgi:hypothetical protein